MVEHVLGEIAAARAGFGAVANLFRGGFMTMAGHQYARHLLDLGNHAAARALCNEGIESMRKKSWNDNVLELRALLARTDLAEGNDPTPHLDEVRT